MTLFDSDGVTCSFDERDEHRLCLVGDRRHLHRHVEVFERHIAVAFAERPLGLQQLGIDQSFNDDLLSRAGTCRSTVRQHCSRCGWVLPPSAPATPISSWSIASFCGPVKVTSRSTADHDGAGHRRLQLAVLEPVLIAAGAADARRHAHAEPVGGFELAAVGAHVLDAALGVLGDAERGGEIWRGVEAGRRDRHRQELPVRRAFCFSASPLMTTSWHGGVPVIFTGAIGLATCTDPGVANLLDRLAHAERVDAG